MPETVTVENGPQTEAARAAAETAALAAQAAVATAAELAAQSQRAAEHATAEIAEETAEELAEQESELAGLQAWQLEHGRLFAEHRESVRSETEALRNELKEIRQQGSTTMELLNSLKSLIQPAPATESGNVTETIPPIVPPEGAAVPLVPETRRKRRLI